MDLKPTANVIPCSTGFVVPTVSRVKLGEPAGKPVGKQEAKPEGRTPGKSAVPPGGNPIGNRKAADPSVRLKNGKNATKKRKKPSRPASAGADHPSVVMAGAWTSRQEQIEEVRAREKVYQYSAPAAENVGAKVAAVKGGDKTSVGSKGRDGVLAGTMQRARRPWEWSANDCEAVLVDVLSCPTAPARLILARLESEGEPAAHCLNTFDKEGESTKRTGEMGWFSSMMVAAGGGEDDQSAEQPTLHRVRDSLNCTTEARAVTEDLPEPVGSSSKLPLGESGVVADLACTNDVGAATQQDSRSHTRGKIKGREVRGKKQPRGNARSTARAGLLTASNMSAESVDAVEEDERKARELSAALNRNRPRRRRSQGEHGEVMTERGSGEKVLESSRRCKTAVDEREGKEASGALNRNRSRPGRPSFLKGLVAGEASEGRSKSEGRTSTRVTRTNVVDAGAVDNTSDDENETTAKAHPWISRGLHFGKGTTAEVWWDNGRWYRCSVSSVSAGGRYGVLEFLPHRRKSGAREYSTQLELDKWILAGHLVRPGTHLEWE